MNMKRSLQEEVNLLHSELCGALADPKRIMILYALAEGSLNVTEIVKSLGFPQPTVSRHLKTLRERGLVTATREAQSVYYALADKRVIEALDILRVVLADLLDNQRALAQSFNQSLNSPESSKEEN
jgi:ArsR family transcriptional regulator